MNLTLFVDESGDFETARGEWVVAGLLCRTRCRDAEADLSSVFGKQVEAGAIPSLAECHLTSIRSKFGVEHASRIRDLVFAELFSESDSLRPTLVAAINEAKRSVHQPERTYRTMLLDLLGLVESSLGECGSIASFEVVIATRTIDGRRLTTLEQLDGQIRDTLPGQLEVGLASRGLWQSFKDHALKLSLTPATKSWGLVVADFTANTLYNRGRKQEAASIEKLQRAGRLTVFESFGSHEERRARVAERDGDRVAAIGRWASITGKTTRFDIARKEALDRLWRDLLKFAGTTGPFASLESVLEWLMRRRLATQDLLEAVSRIEETLMGIASDEPDSCCDRLLYRLRNFRLLNLNHVGRSAEADHLIELQISTLKRLQEWPEMLPHFLDFGAISIESAINKLDFSLASSRASEHLASVKDYMEVWELLTGRSDHSCKSRWYVRAASAFVRARILASSPTAQQEDPAVSGIFAELEDVALHPNDKVRLQCYRLLSLLRTGRVRDALAEAERINSADLNDFALLWLARTVGDALFADLVTPLAPLVLEKLRERTPLLSGDHPAELLWRERAVLERLVAGNRSACRDCLNRSLEITTARDLQAPIGSWLRGVVQMHRAALLGGRADIDSYFKGPFASECRALLSGTSGTEPAFDLVQMVRRVSPY